MPVAHPPVRIDLQNSRFGGLVVDFIRKDNGEMDKTVKNSELQLVRRAFKAGSFMIPAAMGTISMSMGFLLGAPLWGSSLLVNGGLCLIGLGTARAIWKLTLGRQRLRQSVRARRIRSHQHQLRLLYRQMRRDGDTRTNRLLQDLQRIHDRFCVMESNPPSRQSRYSGYLFEQAGELYESCLHSLEKSLDQWLAAREMATDEARDKILRVRENTLDGVEQSIEHLDACLDQLRTASLKSAVMEDESHDRLRQELEQQLEIARRIEQRIDDMGTASLTEPRQ